jgi:hypothetical protein
MAVVSCVEIPRERSQSGKFGETYRYTRGWMVRVDSVSTPLPMITNAHGVSFLDPHPDDATCKAMEFSTKPESNSLLHYTVSVTYFAPPEPAAGEDGKPPEFLPGIPTVWTATSSVGSYPVKADISGKVIANSAGTPFDKVEAERASFKLSLKRPWPDYSWQALAMNYTNAVNSDAWMGMPARCWKCQGMSATPETQNEAGVTRSYWMTSWEFEYRAPEQDADKVTHPGWDLTLIDRGFQCRVDENGIPDPSPSNKIGTVRDAKGQPLKEPVGLRDGMAVTPPANPATLSFQIYRALPFRAVFGV